MTLLDILRRWKAFLLLGSLGVLAGLAVAVIRPIQYVAEMRMSPIDPTETAIPMGGLGAALAGGGGSLLSAIGSFTRGNLGDAESGYFVALLTSDRVAAELLKDKELTKWLFPGEWDARTNTWRRRKGLLASLSGLYRRAFFEQGYSPPNVARTKQRLTRVFKVRYDIDEDTYSLSLKARQCEAATRALHSIFEAADRVMKAEKNVRYRENISLLISQMNDPQNFPIRSEVAHSLLSQLVRQLSTQSSLPLAVRVFDGPGCGDKPALPQPMLYATVGGVLGCILMLVVIFVAGARRSVGE